MKEKGPRHFPANNLSYMKYRRIKMHAQDMTNDDLKRTKRTPRGKGLKVHKFIEDTI